MAAKNDVLLEVKDLKKHFPIKGGLLRRTVGQVKAVDGVNLTVHKGETFAIVGESGCGKSTTGRSILRLEEPTGGEVVYHSSAGPVNIEKAGAKELRKIRPEMQIIFQDPFSSLDARMTVGRIISEPMVINKTHEGQALRDRVAELLRVVGLRPEHASRYPHAFSGGQRQRIGIARALALNPKLIICDEPVSALDVSIQAQIVNLLDDLQEEFGLAYIFIAHDLSVIRHIADRVAVMYLGKIVEIGERDELYNHARHPYTQALLSAVPEPDPEAANRREQIRLTGDVPSPLDPPSGCRFRTRCWKAQEICATQEPPLLQVENAPQHLHACHFPEEREVI